MGYTISAASIQQRVRETPLFRGGSMAMSNTFLRQPPPNGAGGQAVKL
jgi:hypothetical protein